MKAYGQLGSVRNKQAKKTILVGIRKVIKEKGI
jgi:hypothetical protein